MMTNNHSDIEPVKTELQRIFVYYCSFADKESYSLLKIQNYRRFITDLQLANHSALAKQLDLIFYSHAHSTALNLPNFASSLYQIASLAFPDLPKQNRFERLLTLHLQPVYDLILAESDFGQSLQFISAALLKEKCFVFLKRFEGGLLPLYKVYFNQEGKAGKEEEFKMFTKLSRQLNLVPRVTTKPISFLIFQFLRERSSKSAFQSMFLNSTSRNSKNYGFNFVCFMEALVILSHINCREEEKEQLKIYRLLELVEVSTGCQTLSKKMKFPHFFLTQKQLEQVLQDTTHSFSTHSQKQTVIEIKSVENQMQAELGALYDPLKNKFIKLCLKKRVENNFYLPAASAKELLSKICPKLTGIQIELLISSVGRLHFQNFICLLGKAAEKIGINGQILFQQVIAYNTENYSLKLIAENVKLSKKDEIACREVLRLTQNYLKSMYDYYETNGGMTLPAYLKLLQEVAVVSSIVTVNEAADIFRVSVKTQEKLNFEQFKDSFLTITVAVHFDFELEATERLIYLLEKICDSKKGEVLMKKNLLMVKEHPLYMLRLTFNSVYKQIERKLQFNTRSVLAQSKASDQS